MQILLAHGVELNRANNQGATPLWVAARNGHVAVAHTLARHNADLNQATDHGAMTSTSFGPLYPLRSSSPTRYRSAESRGLHHARCPVLTGVRSALVVSKWAAGLTPLFIAAAWGETAMVQVHKRGTGREK